MRILLLILVIAWGCAGYLQQQGPKEPGIETATSMVAAMSSSAEPGKPSGYHFDQYGLLHLNPNTYVVETSTGWEFHLHGVGSLVFYDHTKFSDAYRGTVEATIRYGNAYQLPADADTVPAHLIGWPHRLEGSGQ